MVFTESLLILLSFALILLYLRNSSLAFSVVELVLVPVESVDDKVERTGSIEREIRKKTKGRMIGGERMLLLEAMPGEFVEFMSISISLCSCFCFFLHTHFVSLWAVVSISY